MKQVIKGLVIVSALATAGSAFAEFGDLSPYAGVGLQQAWMKPTDDYNNIAKSFPGAEIYVGTKFHENFGVELTYAQSASRKKSFSEGGITYKTKTVRKSTAIDFLGFMPVADNIDLFASLGYGLVKPSIKATQTNAAGAVDSYKISTKGNGGIRLGLGGIYMLDSTFGVRARLGYDKTSSIKDKADNDKVFKKSITASLGLFVKF